MVAVVLGQGVELHESVTWQLKRLLVNINTR